jgi:hypothetical protein
MAIERSRLGMLANGGSIFAGLENGGNIGRGILRHDGELRFLVALDRAAAFRFLARAKTEGLPKTPIGLTMIRSVRR